MLVPGEKKVGDLWPDLISRAGNNNILERKTPLAHQEGFRNWGVTTSPWASSTTIKGTRNYATRGSISAIEAAHGFEVFSFCSCLKIKSWSCEQRCSGPEPRKCGKYCSACAYRFPLVANIPSIGAVLLLNRWGYCPSSIPVFHAGENEIALLCFGWAQHVKEERLLWKPWKSQGFRSVPLKALNHFSPGQAKRISFACRTGGLALEEINFFYLESILRKSGFSSVIRETIDLKAYKNVNMDNWLSVMFSCVWNR